jgi:acetyl-CoA acetyltransferase family protein
VIAVNNLFDRQKQETKMSKTAIIKLPKWRTAHCRAGTDLSALSAEKLGEYALKEALAGLNTLGVETKDVSKVVDHIIGSIVGVPPHAQNPARVAAMGAGFPASITANGVQMNCGSGLMAIHHARMLIESPYDKAQGVLVLGCESMSTYATPLSESVAYGYAALAQAKNWKTKTAALLSLYRKLLLSPFVKEYQPISGVVAGLTCPIAGIGMGLTAENLAKNPDFNAGREEQERYAYVSTMKARAAKKAGFFERQIAPICVSGKNGEYKWVSEDNGLIPDDDVMRVIQKSGLAFDKKHGTITSKTSSQVTDGAAWMLLMDADKAKALGLPIAGYVGKYADYGYRPEIMGLSPVGAIAELVKKTGKPLDEYKVIELNAAFAAQVLACVNTLGSKELMEKYFDINVGGKLDYESNILNAWGDAVSIFGHPVGATGVRIAQNALDIATETAAEDAIASACIGGGQGAALEIIVA